MRVTVDLKPDELKLLNGFAEANAMTRGAAATHFLRAGLQNPPRTHIVNGLQVVSAHPGAKKFTAERIKEVEEEMDLEYVQRFTGKKSRKKSQ